MKASVTDKVGDHLLGPRPFRLWRGVLICALLLLGVNWGLGWYWSRTPAGLPPIVAEHAGQALTQTLINTTDRLLHKPGGYLSNDILPHRLWLDNMPNWEQGVIGELQLLALWFRDQAAVRDGTLDGDWVRAEQQLRFDPFSWAMPSTEREFSRALDAMAVYHAGLAKGTAVFNADVESLLVLLDSMQQHQSSLMEALAAAPGFFEADDVFYQARGASWARLRWLAALRQDFVRLLTDEPVLDALADAERHLEKTQSVVWTPLIYGGESFGPLPNHTLQMAAHLARANLALGRAVRLLQQPSASKSQVMLKVEGEQAAEPSP